VEIATPAKRNYEEGQDHSCRELAIAMEKIIVKDSRILIAFSKFDSDLVVL